MHMWLEVILLCCGLSYLSTVILCKVHHFPGFIGSPSFVFTVVSHHFTASNNQDLCFLLFRASMQFFIPSPTPVSRKGLMHACWHAYVCCEEELVVFIAWKWWILLSLKIREHASLWLVRGLWAMTRSGHLTWHLHVRATTPSSGRRSRWTCTRSSAGPERRRRSRWTCMRSSAGPERRRRSRWTCRRSSAGPEERRRATSPPGRSRRPSAGPERSQLPQILPSHWMPMILETNVFGRQCFWMLMFLDANVFGRQCFWMPMILDGNVFQIRLCFCIFNRCLYFCVFYQRLYFCVRQ